MFYGVVPEENIDANTIDGNTVSSDEINDTKDANIEILNGSGSSSKLSEVISKLEAEGFEVTQTGNTSTTNNTTIIDRGSISETELSQIKEILHINSVTSGNSDTSTKTTIIIGTDYVM